MQSQLPYKMTTSNYIDYSLLDALILQNQCFAAFFIPGETSMNFILQQNKSPEYLQHLSELNGKEGFVIAPFKVSETKPIVLIHPDVVLKGEASILSFLKKMDLKTPEERCDKPNKSIRTDSFFTYQNAFQSFINALHTNICEKIVLSRTFETSIPLGFSAGKTFKIASEAYPEAFVYLCHTPETGTWLGSSPEIILSGKGENWQTAALAGTKKVSLKNEPVEWDSKNSREQEIVSSYIEKQLNSLHLVCTKNGPKNFRAGRMIHLKTDFNFQLKNTCKIGDLLESLHPTPAVCGYPKAEAYRLILECEGYDRGWYSGFVGPLSTKDTTDLYVNLRCMQVGLEQLTLFAGGGLLSSSDLKTEWEETEEKLQTILSLIEF